MSALFVLCIYEETECTPVLGSEIWPRRHSDPLLFDHFVTPRYATVHDFDYDNLAIS